MNRTQKTLTGLLAVQIVLILLLRSPLSGAGGATEARPLLSDFDALATTRIELLGQEDRKLTLSRQGDSWQLDQLGGFPASKQKVDDLLENLGDLTVRRPVVSSSRYHPTFKVSDEEHEARVKLWAADADGPSVDLIFGSSSNYRVLHARHHGEEPVFEVRGLATYDIRADPGSWADKQLVDIPEEQLVGITIQNSFDSFSLEKVDGVWQEASPESGGEPLDASKVQTLVSRVASMQLAEPVGPIGETETGEVSSTITLRWLDPATEGAAPQEVVIRISEQPADSDSQRYITRSGFDFVGTIWDSSVSALVTEGLADLRAS